MFGQLVKLMTLGPSMDVLGDVAERSDDAGSPTARPRPLFRFEEPEPSSLRLLMESRF